MPHILLKYHRLISRSLRQILFFWWQGIGPTRTGRSAAPAPMSHISQTVAVYLPAAAESTPLSSYGDGDGDGGDGGGGGSQQRNSAGGPM